MDWSDVRETVLERDDYTCQECGKSFRDGRPLEAAHIVARADGGEDSPANVEALCISCHAERDGWDIEDFSGRARRVERVASYVRWVEGLHGAAFIARCGSLLGTDWDDTKRLLRERW